MREITFEQVYPIALRAAQIRATAAVVNGAIPMAEREDFEQEGLAACWRALPRFDPVRASLRTFIENVIAARLASLVRIARRVPAFAPLESAMAIEAADGTVARTLRLDVERLVSELSAEDRELALLLMEYSPAEASRLLDIPPTTLQYRITQLRDQFSKARIAPVARHRKGSAS